MPKEKWENFLEIFLGGEKQVVKKPKAGLGFVWDYPLQFLSTYGKMNHEVPSLNENYAEIIGLKF